MNKLCKLLNLQNEDELFQKITSSFKEKITKWDYFVNWKKVIINVELYEKELNFSGHVWEIKVSDSSSCIKNIISYPK